MKKTRINKLYQIEYPILQAGMVWVSGGRLAAAAANAGCLGIIGAGSMKPDLLREHIRKAKSLTQKPLGVNLPLLYKDIEAQINISLEEGIKHFITSAGSPKKFTQFLKDNNATVTHVTSSATLAKKCEDAGVDAVIVEGFEAGGHNGRDEITSLVLIPQCAKALKIPVIAAGGFACGKSALAGFALGAEGIQMGTRFMMSQESSAHENYKNLLLNSPENATELRMKNLVPVRLLKNKFYEEIKELEENCSSPEKLKEHLGKGRARLGMLEGDLEQGELEAGQVCGNIQDLPTVSELVKAILIEYNLALENLNK
ncbi:MAG: nitronate monooxygenase [Halobacteriovoraceae bacterium]|nr:nitronate monooxygenase [Halobacteriovoraceae bacterium]|tara:strand:+ start:6676 stop:7617 length:942 start_codon:yes stop_codon:yes gene_type:complete